MRGDKAVGGTVTLGWRPGSGIHVDRHLSNSRLSGIELSPAGGVAVIKAAGGSGISAGAAGMRREFQGMTITPCAGREWSSVEIGVFAEPAVEGTGAASDITANSL